MTRKSDLDPSFLKCLSALAQADVKITSEGVHFVGSKHPVGADIWVETRPELVQVFEETGVEGLRSRLPVILDRSASRLTAKRSEGGLNLSGMGQGDVEIAERTHPYSNFFALDELRLRHRRFDGTQSDVMDRAVFLTCDAVLVVPYDPIRQHVLLVEQFRAGPWARCDPNPWQLEPIAGRIDAGETAYDAAIREAQEEAGLNLNRLEQIAASYPSPGTSTEFYLIYAALCDLPSKSVGQHGLAEENEDIQTHLISLETLDEYADQNLISNLPLLTSLHWLMRHRSRLSA